MISLREIISRLMPARLRVRPELTPGKRTELWSTVADQDNCLRATVDQLQETLEGEFLVAIDPQRSDTERLRALEGLRIAYWMLKRIEDERDQAKAWRTEQERARTA